MNRRCICPARLRPWPGPGAIPQRKFHDTGWKPMVGWMKVIDLKSLNLVKTATAKRNQATG
jgi:hypothetical protein